MISLDQWRWSIGHFICGSRHPKIDPEEPRIKVGGRGTATLLLFVALSLLLAGDVESNPGPRTGSRQTTLAAATSSPTTNQITTNDIMTELKCMRTENEAGTAAVRAELSGINSRLDRIEENIKMVQKKNKELENQQEALQNTVLTLSAKIESLEIYSRRENYLIHGVTEAENEDTRETTLAILDELVPIKKWTNDDLQRVHRLGRKGSGNRPIIVRCLRYQDKMDTVTRSKAFRAKSLRVTDDLTVPQRDQLKEIRNNGGHAVFRNGRLRILSPPLPAGRSPSRDPDVDQHSGQSTQMHNSPPPHRTPEPSLGTPQ